MSYSRWGGRGSGYWYTYWQAQDKSTENKDTAIFCVCTVARFTAKELRDDMDKCMSEISSVDNGGDIDELKSYANKFLEDVNRKYPKI